MSDDLAEEIENAYRTLGSPSVAVRSSAVAEDTEYASFAGQQETLLGICGTKEVITAIPKIWASVWSSRSIAYRVKSGNASCPPGIAVIVQQLVPAESAGVVFTVDALSGDSSRMRIEASWGLGTGVVSGDQIPDSFIVDKRTGTVLQSEVSRQKLHQTIVAAGAVRTTSTGRHSRAVASISRSKLQDIAGIAVRIENLFRTPQDIEWALYRDQIYVLQSRPIVGMSWFLDQQITWQPPEGIRSLSRVSVAEYLPNPMSPLFASFQVPAFASAYSEVHEELGLSSIFRYPFLNTVNDYLYIRLDVRPSLEVIPALLTKTLPTFVRIIKQFRSTTLPQITGIKERSSAQPITELGTPELVASIDALCGATAEYWKSIAVSTWIWKLSERLFAWLYGCLFWRSSLPYYHLLSGLPTVNQQAEESLREIAVRFQSLWRSEYTQADTDGLLKSIQSDANGSQFLSDLRHFANQLGFQSAELDFISPTVGEQVSSLVETVANYWKSADADSTPDSGIDRAERRRQAEQSARARLRWLPPIDAFFRLCLSSCQNMTAFREDMNYYLTALWPEIRSRALEIGRRLHSSGLIETADDVFYVTRDEILQQKSWDTGTNHLRLLVAQRKQRRDLLMRIAPPQNIPDLHHLTGIPKVLFGSLFRLLYPETRARRRRTDELVGIPASRGVVTAPVSVVLSVNDFHKFKRGNILVTAITSPVWTPLFTMASGVITDLGGVLSHASIIAREFGIPAVLGTQLATRVLKDGQTVTLDANRGIVKLNPD